MSFLFLPRSWLEDDLLSVVIFIKFLAFPVDFRCLLLVDISVNLLFLKIVGYFICFRLGYNGEKRMLEIMAR